MAHRSCFSNFCSFLFCSTTTIHGKSRVEFAIRSWSIVCALVKQKVSFALFPTLNFDLGFPSFEWSERETVFVFRTRLSSALPIGTASFSDQASAQARPRVCFDFDFSILSSEIPSHSFLIPRARALVPSATAVSKIGNSPKLICSRLEEQKSCHFAFNWRSSQVLRLCDRLIIFRMRFMHQPNAMEHSKLTLID